MTSRSDPQSGKNAEITDVLLRKVAVFKEIMLKFN